jgi:phosphate starvation-inducible PhoH-like protein
MHYYLYIIASLFHTTNAIIQTTSRYIGLPLCARKNRGIVWDENIEDQYYDENYHDFSPSNKMKEIFKPKTPKQKEYYKYINTDELSLVIATGPAGTGKTLFPTQHAAKLLSDTEQKIILTRPLISVDEEIGYLPGTINQKMDPWIIPIFDVLREFFPQQTLNTFIAEKRIEIVPLAFMRGRTFKDTFIIGDELQNTSNKQMLMLLTRLGENSKMVITGDIHQCDNTENGLLDLLERIQTNYHNKEVMKEKMISIIDFDKDDIQRSLIISNILELYEN